eukprot:TRINITY_DN13470_c0_g1_i1.p2 TRINITY_DN13470_c0_g1~~TRINITY_DN13470_c0_g1_i1.p2  ORF type:complete len:175 (+),score=50.66 TRINITY_DN13470_c0_g1_i1:31-525(+)
MDDTTQTTEQKDDFVPIKIDPSKMEEVMLRLDDRGLEDRLHADFYENLINFGVDKKYVDSMRDEFTFEKLDLKTTIKDFDQEEEDELAADRFIKAVELEELQMQLADDETAATLSQIEKNKINERIFVLQKEMNEMEGSFTTLAIAAEREKVVFTQKLKAKKDD